MYLNEWIASAKRWAKTIKRDAIALYLASYDPRVPWYAKILAFAVAAYAFSPIDLIPDFIPVLGYLDDLIIVPVGILIVVALIPEEVMKDLRSKASEIEKKPTSYVGLAIIVTIWFACAAAFFRWYFRND